MIFYSKGVIPIAKIYKSVIVQVVTKTFGTQKKTEKVRSTIHTRPAYLKMLLNHQMVNLVGYLNSVYTFTIVPIIGKNSLRLGTMGNVAYGYLLINIVPHMRW